MKYAIVDLGSNTVRLSVYVVNPEGNCRLLFSEKETAGLNSYIVDHVLTHAGIQRACGALNHFQNLLEQFGVAQMRVFATASLRNIRNTQEAVAQIAAETGIAVEVVSGSLEAELGYAGVIREHSLENGVVFDIGGGSTEIAQIQGGRVASAQSIPVGCLELFNRHVKKIWPKKEELKAIQAHARQALEGLSLPEKNLPLVCGVGGTARAMLKITNALLSRPDAPRSMTMEEFSAAAQCLLARKGAARDVILKVCPDRLHTILPGVVLMQTVCEALGCQSLYVSPYGVREGYLHRCLQQEQGGTP